MEHANKPKYQKLKDYIINIINSGELKSDEKIYSENELAQKFDISRHTVRQAIGELTNEGWLYRVQGKGTFVNERLEHKNINKNIGVVTTFLSDYIFPSIIRGIDEVLSKTEYNIVIGCTNNKHEKERAVLQNLLDQNIDGLIIEATKSALPNPNLDLYLEFKNRDIPIVFIHEYYRDITPSYVVEDDFKAGFMAAMHLIDLGHKKIGGIFKIDDIQGHKRFAGFQKAQLDSGIKCSDSSVLWYDTDDVDMKINMEDSMLNILLSECTAIECYNDQISLKIIEIAKKKGIIIPQQLSIVSFDDSQLALASEVKLTTIAHPKEALGREAANAMLAIINKTINSYYKKMEPKLIVRESTKKYQEV